MFELKKVEDEILNFWEKEKIYEKVKKKNSKGKKFYFLQGPPYTSGKIHIGQAWNNSMKDMTMRYKRMQGFDVWDRAGYDMHGLPTEHAVQKKLKLKTKEDIHNYGMDKFIKACLDFSNEHAEYMNKDLWKLGVWMDYENAYKPIQKEFIDGQWAFFKKAWEQGRLYRGSKVMHWDAETETSLAKHELEYKNVKDKSVFLKFKKRGKENEYFVIWTTTPWTIPFNLAIMVNPNLHYVDVEIEGERWTLADSLAGVFISGLLGKKYKIIGKRMGSDLEGEEYIHPFYDELKEPYDKLKKESPKTHSIILSEEYVDTSAGSGLVHCAPGCGPEDFEVAQKNNILPFNTLNERGEFIDMGKFTGWVAKTDDSKFIEEFDKKGVLITSTEIEHEYPHSDRSKKPVVFRLTEQWFLKTQDLSKRLVELNSEVSWVPKKSGESYHKWTSNLKDNSVTRQRFWGCPVPIWINEKDPEDIIVIGGVKELEKLTGKKFNDLSLHKPLIDKVTIEKSGKKYRRILDVADVWLDSGTTSWNCLYNDAKLIKKYFPADFVLEATEQTRLWFSLLQICSAIMFDKTAYENVYTTGMIFDFQGTKMSKSLGNIISPYEVIDKYSADILRYYLCGVSAGENINFSWEDVKNKQKNLVILSNIANYIIDLEKQDLKKGKKSSEDKWILSKYNQSLEKVTQLFDEYKLDEVVSLIEELYISLSRDYIKLVRDRASEDSAVLDTVKEVYLGILKMFAPICPFITESLFMKMKQDEKSVHLSDWPKFDKKKIDKNLDGSFSFVLEAIEKGFAERDRVGIGLKWPLASADVYLPVKLGEELYEIIARQLNVKKVNLKNSDKEIKIILDTKQTPELEAEGFAREISRKVQAERKNLGLQKTDRIDLDLWIGSEIRKNIIEFSEFIKERTGTDKIRFVDDKESMILFKVRDINLGISIKS